MCPSLPHFVWKSHIVGSMDQESSQQLQMWFSEHVFAPKLAGLIVTPIVSATVEQKWREKMSEKPHSIRLLRWFNFSQSGSRKNNRNTFEGASVEPTTQTIKGTFVKFSFITEWMNMNEYMIELWCFWRTSDSHYSLSSWYTSEIPFVIK